MFHSNRLRRLRRDDTRLVFWRRTQKPGYDIFAILGLEFLILRTVLRLKAAIAHALNLTVSLLRHKFAGLRRTLALILANVYRRHRVEISAASLNLLVAK